MKRIACLFTILCLLNVVAGHIDTPESREIRVDLSPGLRDAIDTEQSEAVGPSCCACPETNQFGLFLPSESIADYSTRDAKAQLTQMAIERCAHEFDIDQLCPVCPRRHSNEVPDVDPELFYPITIRESDDSNDHHTSIASSSRDVDSTFGARLSSDDMQLSSRRSSYSSRNWDSDEYREDRSGVDPCCAIGLMFGVVVMIPVIAVAVAKGPR